MPQTVENGSRDEPEEPRSGNLISVNFCDYIISADEFGKVLGLLSEQICQLLIRIEWDTNRTCIVAIPCLRRRLQISRHKSLGQPSAGLRKRRALRALFHLLQQRKSSDSDTPSKLQALTMENTHSDYLRGSPPLPEGSFILTPADDPATPPPPLGYSMFLSSAPETLHPTTFLPGAYLPEYLLGNSMCCLLRLLLVIPETFNLLYYSFVRCTINAYLPENFHINDFLRSGKYITCFCADISGFLSLHPFLTISDLQNITQDHGLGTKKMTVWTDS